ncbi:MAG TPA: methyl-accepting chemotaxis protein, partial [Myxococcota bacterium]|nr:methyl-accepting chemotaxis protein [Myxococcota bacterium]
RTWRRGLELSARAATLSARERSHEAWIREISATAQHVDTLCHAILLTSADRQRGSVEQSSSVSETRAAMQGLLASGANITHSAQVVLANAEQTQRNSAQVAERVTELSTQAGRMAQTLDVIQEVANKSDLLSLNAALEGVRAGSMGRGFALVAAQMQQLAENIMRAVADIKSLTSDIREASLATELSNFEATRLAGDTTQSARRISSFIHEQQAGTEQVSRALDDILQVAQAAATGGEVTLTQMSRLQGLAERLRDLVTELQGAGKAADEMH